MVDFTTLVNLLITEHQFSESTDDLTKDQLVRLTELIELYMTEWSNRDNYRDFRMFQNIYTVLCNAVKREPKGLLSLVK